MRFPTVQITISNTHFGFQKHEAQIKWINKQTNMEK